MQAALRGWKAYRSSLTGTQGGKSLLGHVPALRTPQTACIGGIERSHIKDMLQKKHHLGARCTHPSGLCSNSYGVNCFELVRRHTLCHAETLPIWHKQILSITSMRNVLASSFFSSVCRGILCKLESACPSLEIFHYHNAHYLHLKDGYLLQMKGCM